MRNFTGSEDSDFSSLKEEQIQKAVNDLFIKRLLQKEMLHYNLIIN